MSFFFLQFTIFAIFLDKIVCVSSLFSLMSYDFNSSCSRIELLIIFKHVIWIRNYFIHSNKFFHAFIQQIFSKYLLRPRHCLKQWIFGVKSNQSKILAFWSLHSKAWLSSLRMWIKAEKRWRWSKGSSSVRSLEEEEPTKTLRRNSFCGRKETRRVWHSWIPVDTVIDQPCQMLPSSGENDLWISRMESLPTSPRWLQWRVVRRTKWSGFKREYSCGMGLLDTPDTGWNIATVKESTGTGAWATNIV